MHLGASLTGLGGAHADMVYSLDTPKSFSELCFCAFENIKYYGSTKIWAQYRQDKYVEVFCDNLAVVQV